MSSGNWLSSHELNPRAEQRLYCLPYAGGGASFFRRWTPHVPAEIDLVPIQLPGREGRLGEKPFDSLPPLVDTLNSVLAPQLDLPFALFGYSLGALICFELARALRRDRAAQPVCLFVAACRPPHLERLVAPIHALPDDDFIREVDSNYGGIPAAVANEPELMQLLLPTLRADLTLIETYQYRPAPPLDCPIVAIGGESDSLVPPEDLQAWREHTTQSFSMHLLPGGHFFLDTARDEFFELLRRELILR